MKKILKYAPVLFLLGGISMPAAAFEKPLIDQRDSSKKIRITISEEAILVDLEEDMKELRNLSKELEKISKEMAKQSEFTVVEASPFVYEHQRGAERAGSGPKDRNRSTKPKKRFKFSLLTMDVGINGFIDNTDYTSAEAMNFVRVPDANRSERTFDIKNGQSRNINLWPASFNFDLSGSRNQKVYLSVGIPGFQFYSLKYNNSIQFQEGMDPHVIETDEKYKKNKLGITYLSIPLSVTGQTRITKSKWLTYGAGIIGGYRIASWTNQKTPGEGKSKVKDPFNLNDYQLAVTGELGVKGILRLYATYNLTNMWENSLDQNLFAVGIRFFGI